MGALIGVPLAAVIYSLLKELMDYIALKKQKEKELKVTPEQLEIPN